MFGAVAEQSATGRGFDQIVVSGLGVFACRLYVFERTHETGYIHIKHHENINIIEHGFLLLIEEDSSTQSALRPLS